jgi:hypothetical protein
MLLIKKLTDVSARKSGRNFRVEKLINNNKQAMENRKQMKKWRIDRNKK